MNEIRAPEPAGPDGPVSASPFPERPVVFQARGLCKSYAAPVLREFHLSLHAGEVHALMGANGAGKSTFARIVCGHTRADAGSMTLANQPYAPANHRAGEQAGVVLVPQELNILPTLTVAENLFLDRLPTRHGLVDRVELNRRAAAALERVGLSHLSPGTLAGRLGVGEQQLVEIGKGLTRDCRLLILDEPTAALTDPEIETLFANMRRLTAEGVAIIYISHRMDEIRRIADRLTVLRDGVAVATHAAAHVSPEQIVAEMSGHEVPARDHSRSTSVGEPLLVVDRLCAGPRVREVSLTVRRGEIVGLAGLIGAGRTETLRALFGADLATSGTVRVAGGTAVRFRDPAEAISAGLGLVPEDRKQDGLLLPKSIVWNTTLATLEQHAHWGWIEQAEEARATTAVCDRLNVRRTHVGQPVRSLSGGNQQKVVLARWLERDCLVLLCDEPTRGVDAAAKGAIHTLLREFAAAGRGVLLASSELPELMALCDRILVMSAGRVTGEFDDGDWSSERIHAAAFAGHRSRGVTV